MGFGMTEEKEMNESVSLKTILIHCNLDVINRNSNIINCENGGLVYSLETRSGYLDVESGRAFNGAILIIIVHINLKISNFGIFLNFSHLLVLVECIGSCTYFIFRITWRIGKDIKFLIGTV